MAENNEQFLTIAPENALVAKHVKYYYFHRSFDEGFSKDIIYHPHYVAALNVYKNAEVKWNALGRTYVPSTAKKLSVLFTINNKRSSEVKLRGKFNKIGIVFNLLGINHFIKGSLSKVIEHKIADFDYFGEPLLDLSDRVYAENAITQKRYLLDDFFAQRYQGFPDARLEVAISHILKSDYSPKAQYLADDLGISRKPFCESLKSICVFPSKSSNPWFGSGAPWNTMRKGR